MDLPSLATMDEVARRLGAPHSPAFVATASPAMLCAFKLACSLYDENAVLRSRLARLGQ